MLKFANKLKELRTNKGLTQKEIAMQAKISLTSYIKYELGERTPPLDILINIATILNVSIDELVGYATTTTKLQALNKELHPIGGVIPLDKGYLLSTFDFDYMINDLDEFASGLFTKLDELQNNISELKKQAIYDYIYDYIVNYRNSHLKSDFNNVFGSELDYDTALKMVELYQKVVKENPNIPVDELEKILKSAMTKKAPASDPTTDKD